MMVIFFSQISKFDVDFRNGAKTLEKFFLFLDNSKVVFDVSINHHGFILFTLINHRLKVLI